MLEGACRLVQQGVWKGREQTPPKLRLCQQKSTQTQDDRIIWARRRPAQPQESQTMGEDSSRGQAGALLGAGPSATRPVSLLKNKTSMGRGCSWQGGLC